MCCAFPFWLVTIFNIWPKLESKHLVWMGSSAWLFKCGGIYISWFHCVKWNQGFTCSLKMEVRKSPMCVCPRQRALMGCPWPTGTFLDSTWTKSHWTKSRTFHQMAHFLSHWTHIWKTSRIQLWLSGSSCDSRDTAVTLDPSPIPSLCLARRAGKATWHLWMSGELAQWLGALAAVVKDLSSIPITHRKAYHLLGHQDAHAGKTL